MARTRTVGVLLVVATLLLWGSAAAATTSLSPGGGAVDTASTAQIQQEEEEEAAENASVEFDDQTVEDGTVTVESVTVPDGGYVVIHNDSLADDGDAVGSVIGVSDYLGPGDHDDVTVTLYEDVPGANFAEDAEPTGTETLTAMPHMETSEELDDDDDDETTTTTTEDTTTTTTETTTADTISTPTTTETTTADTTTTTENNDTTTTEDDTTTTEDDTTTATTTGDETTTEDGATTTQETGNDESVVNAQQQQQTQADQTFDFVESDGEEDGPYTEDGEAVTDDAEVDFGQADEPEDDEEEAEAGDDDEADDDEADDDADVDDDDDEADAAASNFTVSNLSAPALAGPNETVTVDATLTNTGDEERSEDVAFRLAGDGADVVVYQSVSIEGDENETVTFEVNASDVGEGEYIHGVTTENSSAFATIEVTNESQVVFEDQASDGEQVTVESVFVPEGGYVTIHDDSLLDGDAVGSVIGVSDYLEPGVHENVSVALYEGVEGAEFEEDALTEDDATLIAMPHLETTDNETYEFVDSEGEDDGPYTVDGEAVVDAGNVTVTADDAPSGGDEDPSDN